MSPRRERHQTEHISYTFSAAPNRMKLAGYEAIRTLPSICKKRGFYL